MKRLSVVEGANSLAGGFNHWTCSCRGIASHSSSCWGSAGPLSCIPWYWGTIPSPFPPRHNSSVHILAAKLPLFLSMKFMYNLDDQRTRTLLSLSSSPSQWGLFALALFKGSTMEPARCGGTNLFCNKESDLATKQQNKSRPQQTTVMFFNTATFLSLVNPVLTWPHSPWRA